MSRTDGTETTSRGGRTFAIFGGVGFGECVADYISVTAGPDSVAGFLNDFETAGSYINGHKVLGKFEDWRKLPEDVLFNAPLHLVKKMQERAARIEELGVPEARWGTVIHHMASVTPSARIGAGSSAGAFAVLSSGTQIGAHVGIWSNVHVGHDARIDDFVFFGSHSVALGYVEIGKGAHIGASAVIKERVKIGEFAVVGLGSVVLKDVEPYSIVAGVPARKVGEIEKIMP